MVLVELINRLKPFLDVDPATGQPYQFTIIGPSMGGLVSRYALAYMEKQKANNVPVPTNASADYWEHNTATWLSFDAPHQGAVIPMGDQGFLAFFQGLSESARETLNNSVNSPAAKQMLVHHVLAPGNTPAGAPGFRDRFMVALNTNGEANSLGYPVHLRRIALANGRLNGQGDFGNSCDKMFDVDVSLRTGNAILATIFSVLFSPLSQVPTRIAGGTARYAPAPGTSCTVFDGVVNYSIYGYSFPGSFTYVPLQYRRVVNAGSQGSFDLAPGGSRSTQDALKRQAEAGGRYSGGSGREQAYKVEVTNVSPNHCFIPTVSALGFQYQSMATYQNTSSLPNSYTNLLTRGSLVCNNEIPFDAFYASPSTNTEHVTVADAAAQAFLFRELTPKVATPVFTVAPVAVCPDAGNRVTFSVDCVLPSGRPTTTYTWTAGPGLTIVGGQSTRSVVVESTPGATGGTTLQVVATRAGFVASDPATVNVLITNGYVDTNLDLQGVQKVCPYTTVVVRVTGVNVRSPYYWTETHYRNGSPRGTFSFTTTDPEYAVSVDDEPVDLTVTAQDICTGQTVAEAPRTITPYVDPNGGFYCDPYSLRVAPNPADDYVEVSTRPGNAVPPPPLPNHANPHAFQATLHNGRGQVVLSAATADGQVRLNTAVLPAGLYYLVVRRGRQVIRRNLSVRH